MALTLQSVSKPKLPHSAWKAGQSGNPKGAPPRSAGRTVQELARDHTEEAMKTLVICLRNPRERLPAAIAILDRGWGRPAQRIESDGNTHLHLHLLAAQMIEALDAPQQQQEQQQPLVIDGTPTE